MKQIWIILISLFVISVSGFSQVELNQSNADQLYQKANKYFAKEKYVIAQDFFEKAIDAYAESKSVNKINAEYYASICALELYHKDAEKRISDFIIKYPESPLSNLANWQMGRYYFREKKYKQSVYWLAEVEVDQLSKDQKEEFHFKNGYALYRFHKLGKAKIEFLKIKDKDTKYTSPAVYYYAQIAYEQKNYETALKHFERLAADKTFSAIVPYYIAQIYYLQRKYDMVIEYAPQLLENSDTKRANEIARTLGEAYYHKKEYDKALPLMEKFLEEAKDIKRDDNYLIGYIYYRNEQYQKAADAFAKVTTEDDVLNQNAYYHLGDCYLQLQDKKKAASAFQMAAKYDFDANIKEEALYNYAKLTFELYYSPFNESIDILNEYITQYPNTTRTDEAYNYLVTAYMNTKNYKDALNSLEQIKNKSHDIKKAYQRVAFYRGLELFNNLKYVDAIYKFDKSLLYPTYDRTIMATSYYWRGEAHYRVGNYKNAIADFKQFILSSGSFELPEFKMAHYSLGYSYFKTKNYEEAITWFRKFISLSEEKSIQEVADAYNRTGDCYYLLRKYWVAIEYYDYALELRTYDADYALYQRAFALGLVERPNKKIASLEDLMNNYPKSAYFDDVLYELGKTYLEIGNNEAAIKYYDLLVKSYPASPYFKKSMVQLGLIYYNGKQNDKALLMYKRVVSEFKGSSEAKNALVGIENIYIGMAQVDEYVRYVESLGDYGTISTTKKDSMSYAAAENVYMDGDCDKANVKLKDYLEQFPNGNFAVNANFYLADCYQRMSRFPEAVAAYKYVINQPKTDFTEQALLGAAILNHKLENYTEALDYYMQLENVASMKSNLKDSRIGILRINFLLKKYEKTIEAANKVMATEKMPVELIREARFNKAQSNFELQNYDLALSDYKLLAEDVKNEIGSEANYKIIEIYFEANELDKAENEIFSFAEKNSPYKFWLANSFIILADIYMKKDDGFQAKATLQSVIDGYDNAKDGIIDMANEKLMEIIKNEKGDQLVLPDSLIDEIPKEIIKPEEKDSILNKTAEPDTIIFSNPKQI